MSWPAVTNTNDPEDQEVDKALEEHNKNPMPDAPVHEDFDNTQLHSKLMIKLKHILDVKTANKKSCADVLTTVNESIALMVMTT